jgi:hypothetical protein|tara:strand:+ start:235 stop:486 length:252 start_codon:yes stop_codon:yes gene_type:complete
MLKRKELRFDKMSSEVQEHYFFRHVIWESGSGKKTLLKSMDKNHIINVIKKHKRGDYKDPVDEEFMELLKMELIYRQVVNINH